MTGANLVVRTLRDFDDPTFGRDEWNRLLATGQSDVVFLTWEWQSAWWESFGRGTLRLVVAERAGGPVALAPLYTEAGMIYFVGSGGSDYLDFIGDTSEQAVMDALLAQARAGVSGFIGFVFYHVPDDSETGRRIEQSAARLGMKLVDEGDQPAPVLGMASKEAALAAANKKSLVRHERFFSRDASFKVSHLQNGDEILPHLDEFFTQHQERWAGTPHPSLFGDEAQRRFYRRIIALCPTPGARLSEPQQPGRSGALEGSRDAGESMCCGSESRAPGADWLRFTRLDWQGRAIAFHFGFCHRGRFLWYKPSFAIDLAKHSPGEVLLRQLILAAHAEGAHTFDFGLGDETFKSRFATRVHRVRNWGLYDPRALTQQTTRTT